MKIIKKIVDLRKALAIDRKNNEKMVRRSIEENDKTVVSIFLNPTQFNDQSDFVNYPQTFDADCMLMQTVGADYVFAPSVTEIYPEPDTRQFSFPPVTTVMEGARRPGHFNGVCQVVSRLFDIVQPDNAYFGEKDWQQIAVVKQLVNYMGSSVNIVECPIIREESGLAMSSRNARLTTDERKLAATIYKILKESLEKAKTSTVKETRAWVIGEINAHEGLEVEYFSIVDGLTLVDLDNWNDSSHAVGCITVYCGSTPIRLIDHIKYYN